MYNLSGTLAEEMTAGPDSDRHLIIVPFFGNTNVPIVPQTGVGSLSPAISTVIHSLVPGMTILPR
jgi:hypothetical protein